MIRLKDEDCYCGEQAERRQKPNVVLDEARERALTRILVGCFRIRAGG